MSKITKVHARQVFDSRGNPTIEAEVSNKKISATAISPSGASTGTYEAYEKRDFGNKRYLGKSVLNAVKLINTKVSRALKNKNVHNQTNIDQILIKLDGTKQKKKLGANSILAVSIAAISVCIRDSFILRPAVPLNPTTSDASTAIIAITTSNSISVNPSVILPRFIDLLFLVPIFHSTIALSYFDTQGTEALPNA